MKNSHKVIICALRDYAHNRGFEINEVGLVEAAFKVWVENGVDNDEEFDFEEINIEALNDEFNFIR